MTGRVKMVGINHGGWGDAGKEEEKEAHEIEKE